jgi:hypothetical protein
MAIRQSCVIVSLMAAAGMAGAARAQSPFAFNTGVPDGLMATASRPESEGVLEIESADDFVLATDTRLTHASFTGLIPSNATVADIQRVVVEIYRVFPLDSDTTRVASVPTRMNSPSDVAFQVRDTANGSLEADAEPFFEDNFSVLNSVVNGIHASPNQNTHGEGPVQGREVLILVGFRTPIDLPPGRYFFIPQVTLASGTFLWLSAPKPIPAPADLQAWIRNGDLDPDWLRVGGDIVGGSPAPAFNMAFTLEGSTLCYANCDGSTDSPVLNVHDFTCFLNRFAQGDSYANCDQSTTPPVLNVADFGCFLNRFVTGCT